MGSKLDIFVLENDITINLTQRSESAALLHLYVYSTKQIYDLNHKHAIYQRMLYDYVSLAIENKSTELRFGRTAEEIKSTIGAEPVAMSLYIRHKNHITNKILKPIFASIKPSEFELRRPFKALEYAKAEKKDLLQTSPS